MQQEYTSKDTCVRTIPSVFKFGFKELQKRGSVNLDIGGGKYDDVTEYLGGFGVRNLVYDPFNRDPQHNNWVLFALLGYRNAVDTVTVANVLNVIKEPEARADILRTALALVQEKNGVAYIQIYEGDGSGSGKKTTKGWQNNLKAAEYIPEVKRFFNSVSRQGNILVATPFVEYGDET